MSLIGLFYGSSTCYTEIVAEKIQATLGKDLVDCYNVADEDLSTALQYNYLILGTPTWDFGELQEDWEEIWPELSDLDLNGKKIALFGLGDQVGYPKWFLDAMGYLYQQVIKQGGECVGYWPNKGYNFDESVALTEDKKHFVGLALDEENDFSKSDERINNWCQQIKKEFLLE